MTSILSGPLAERLSDALTANSIPYSVTIVRRECDSDPFNPVCTDVPYTASGWLDTFSARDVDGTLIKATDIKAFILCDSLDITPTTTDKLVANSITYTCISVQRDPAGACWIVQARQ